MRRALVARFEGCRGCGVVLPRVGEKGGGGGTSHEAAWRELAFPSSVRMALPAKGDELVISPSVEYINVPPKIGREEKGAGRWWWWWGGVSC